MTEGPQQPHNPQQGQQGWQDRQDQWGQRNQQQQPPQAPSWNSPAGWAPPVPGQGTRGPAAPSPAPFTEPDWSALAEQSEARARRRKLMFAGGGVLAVLAIAGIVAAAVVTTNDKDPVASPTASSATTAALPPAPSFASVTPQPTYNSLDFISSAKKDTAALSVDTLFPEKKTLSMGNDRTYTKTASASTGSCSSAASTGLGTILRNNGCRKLFRVTYVRGAIAVTVGVAVFDDAAAATRTKAKTVPAADYVLPLAGGSQGTFCHATSCLMSANATGRYAYFTAVGLANNGRLTAGNAAAEQAGTDGRAYAFSRIVQRGKDAVASAIASPPAS